MLLDHPAFKPIIKTGYSLEEWSIGQSLIHWDTLFAFGFTSYQTFLSHIRKHRNEPLDEVREILMRLYIVEPEFPRLFVPPRIDTLVDFVFNLPANATEEEKKRCVSQLAPVLGRDRGSGYRWLRNSQHAANTVSLPIRRLSAKVFSMNPAYAREAFWRAAFATAAARGNDLKTVENRLANYGVTIEKLAWSDN